LHVKLQLALRAIFSSEFNLDLPIAFPEGIRDMFQWAEMTKENPLLALTLKYQKHPKTTVQGLINHLMPEDK